MNIGLAIGIIIGFNIDIIGLNIGCIGIIMGVGINGFEADIAAIPPPVVQGNTPLLRFGCIRAACSSCFFKSHVGTLPGRG